MKGGGCKKEFVVSLQFASSAFHRCCRVVHCKRFGISGFLQAWSKCVDKERDEGRDFTEECKEVVSVPWLVCV